MSASSLNFVLQSVEIFHWMGIEHRKLDSLSQGLNLVLGENESGKSRLVEAIHFALFESHKGKAGYRKKLRSKGRSEDPRVRVSFRAGDTDYVIEKQFLSKPDARLSTDTQTWEKDDAIEQMQQLTGTSTGKNHKKVDSDDLGIWRCTWIAQGRSSDPSASPADDLVSEVEASLNDKLAAEVGAATAGVQGEAILKSARAHYLRYFTATGKKTGDYKKSEEEKTSATTELEACLEAIEERKVVADRLTENLKQHTLTSEKLVSKEAELAALQSERESAAELEAELELNQNQHALAELKAQTCLNAVAHREQTETKLAALQSSLEEHTQKLELSEAELSNAAEAVRAAASDITTLNTSKTEAKEQLRLAQGAQQRVQKKRSQGELETKLERALAAASLLEASRQLLKSNRVTAEVLTEANQLQTQINQLQVRIQERSAKVSAMVTITAHRALSLNGGVISAGSTSTIVVDDEQLLRFDDWADITVRTGGEGLDSLRDELVLRQRELGELLENHGAESMVQLQSLSAQHSTASAQADQQQEVVRIQAPDGISALQEQIDQLKTELLQEQSGSTSLSLEQAQAAYDAVDAALTKKITERTVLAEQLSELRAASAGLQATIQNTNEQLHSTHEKLNVLETMEALQEASAQAQNELNQIVALLGALNAQYQQLGLAEMQRNIVRISRVIASLNDKQKQLWEGIIRDRASLERASGRPLLENRQEAESELERRVQIYQRLHSRAQSAKLLYETLSTHHNAVRERFLQPIRERIEPQLRRIFPGSTLAYEEGKLVGLRTGTITETFDELSGGAKEQFSILVRATVAQILAGEGRFPLILDDAMVHTDARRRHIMLNALDKYSDQLQIIVFSCHDSFEDIGAESSYQLPPAEHRR